MGVVGSIYLSVCSPRSGSSVESVEDNEEEHEGEFGRVGVGVELPDDSWELDDEDFWDPISSSLELFPSGRADAAS